MSTYWGYHCRTCPQASRPDDEYAYTAYSQNWMNHGEHVLRDLAKLTPHFVAIYRGDTSGYVEMTVMAYGTDPIGWLIEHSGHDIELYNEYGDMEPIDHVP